MSVVAENKVVTIHYTLTDDDGEELDSSRGGEPLEYLQGAENIVPGLENALLGKNVGDKLTVVVEPEDGYGERDEEAIQHVPRDKFPAKAKLSAGMPIHAQTEDGETVQAWIVDVKPNQVTVDFNHPLAGERLHFAVEIVSVREATAEELEHGHPHGPDGHHHH